MAELDEKKIKYSQEKIKTINLGSEDDIKEVKINTKITKEKRERLICLLQKFVDAFAWSYQDMPRLDIDIVTRKLPLKKGYKPVKQKLRRMRFQIFLKIKKR